MQVPKTNAASESPPYHWLDRYANGYHRWHRQCYDHDDLWYRPQGIVEGFFDTDGTEFEGRADVSSRLVTEIRTSLSPEALRARILLVWAVFRYQHALVSAKALDGKAFLRGEADAQALELRYFVVKQQQNLIELLTDGRQHVRFVEDHYPDVDSADFYHHITNAARVIDPTQALAVLFVLPLKPTDNGTYILQTIMVTAHEICDGLTVYRWHSHLIDLLNLSLQSLLDHANNLLCTDLTSRLPPAQEDLYPPMFGSVARQRWRWAISRILRHTRRPPPPSFPNPLRRSTPLDQPLTLLPIYSAILDYTRLPPLTSHTLLASLSPLATSRLTTICRNAQISMGAGLFALIGIVMMHFHERIQPNHILTSHQLPFVGSFPINPRPFLSRNSNTRNEEESLMLAFSDGLTLPFLPSHLPLDGRLRLLGKIAHRQLAQYQKSRKNQSKLASRRQTDQLIPALYLGSIERLESKSPQNRKKGVNPQGDYPASDANNLATCGVSSIGNRTSLIQQGKYNLHQQVTDLSVDFRALYPGVRPREGEFLVGVTGDGNTVKVGVSFDGNAIDPDKAGEWKRVLEGILEDRRDKDGRVGARL